MPATARGGGLDLAGRSVLVVGLGASGRAAVEALVEAGARVRASEVRTRADVAAGVEAAESLGAEVLTGGHAAEHLRGIDLVVVSPGVPEHADVLRWAGNRGVPILSEIDVGARLADAPYVAVTGTNGKTTTTELVAAAMRAGGLGAVACGNAGHPFSRAAREGHDALAVEVSSFQLRFHESLRPRVSVLLNLAEDHLDWHGGFEAYRDAKARIFALQGPGDVHVGNRDDARAAEVSRRAPARLVWTTLGAPGEHEVGYEGPELVARIDGERRLGTPAQAAPAFLADAAAAAAASLAFGVPADAVAETLRSFVPLPHRGSVVAEAGGVRFVDDSKATNPHAALGSIAGWEGAVLIAGGLAKGVDLSPLAGAADRLRGVVAIGEAAPVLAELFDGRVPFARAGSIEEAVRTAHAMAPPGGVVLLAPACASQDMFRDYRERGERFAATAARLASDEGSRG